MECINGGSWFSDVCNWVGNSLQAAWNWATSNCNGLSFTFYYEYDSAVGPVYGVRLGY